MEQETELKYSLEDIAYLSRPVKSGGDESQKGKSFLAISGAMVWPGLGHLIAGNIRWAAIWFSMWVGIIVAGAWIMMDPRLLPGLVVLLPLALVVEFSQLLHAGRCGGRSVRSMLGDASSRYTVGLILGAFGLGECYEGTAYLQANWVEVCYTPTPSMAPNVSPGDLFVFFKQLSYGRWDIVGLDSPTSDSMEIRHLCKRIVGLPGDEVEITGSGLLINGKPVKIPAHVGPYLPVDSWNNSLMDAEPMAAANGCWGRPITLGRDEYFLLGDNTAISDDGRFWPSVRGHQPGATPRDQIHGRVVGIIWPLDRWRMFDSAGDSGGQ
jgi:signal peptidase I